MTGHDDCCAVHRRGFLGSGLAAGLALVGVGALGSATAVRAASLTEAQRAALSPDQVVQAMLDGNARFLSGVHRQRDFLAEMRSSAAGQFPAAIVLSCVDSRAPVEVICDLGIGDTFNARVAGNAVNDDILGSMEFACAAAGAKAVVVMGHTACGAIKGAIDATDYSGERTSKNYGFVDAVAKTNVRMVIDTIRERSEVLAGLEKQGKINLVGSMYDIASGKVMLV